MTGVAPCCAFSAAMMADDVYVRLLDGVMPAAESH